MKSPRIAIHLADITNNDEGRLRVPAMNGLQEYAPDLVLFPERYLHGSNADGIRKIRNLSKELRVPFAYGIKESPLDNDYWSQYISIFDSRINSEDECAYYQKHTSKGTHFNAWDGDIIEDHADPIEVNGTQYGFTICHDLFLVGLHSYQARRGSKALLCSTWYKVKVEKWGTLARLRALENSIPMLICLHTDNNNPAHHPFAFDVNGQEMKGIRLKDGRRMWASEMHGSNETYIFELPSESPLPRLEALRMLPDSDKNSGENVERNDSVQFCLKNGELHAPAGGNISIIRIDGMDILDFKKHYTALASAWKQGRKAIFWNHWDKMAVPSSKLVHLMLGRTLEFCTPVVLTDNSLIHEVTELATDTKVLRRLSPSAAKVWVDMQRAFGYWNSMKITVDHLVTSYAKRQLGAVIENYEKLL